MVVLKPVITLFWSAPECGHKNMEYTGNSPSKSPDPLYLCAGDAIHPVLRIKGSGTKTNS